jgi:signal transduction histidine kinase
MNATEVRPREGGADLPALLPGALLVDPAAERGRTRRSARDWAVDVVVFVVAAGGGALVLLANQQQLHEAPAWLQAADIGGGALCCIALWWRRRWPVAIALGMLPFACYAASPGFATLVIVFTVAIYRPFAISAPIATLHAASSFAFAALRPAAELPYFVVVAFGVVLTFAALAWGTVVRARRQLILSLRDRAFRAEAEQQLRVAQARQLERARIAREMHDVLAHRISLLSLHAGALEFRTDATGEEVARAAGVIRSSAHQALEDLREVIGVLRDDAPVDPHPPRPQPTLADLPALVAESVAAGTRVRLDNRVDDRATVPAALGRNAYRVVQEGLTNARKHAAGAAVEVRIEGAAGDGLTVVVRNPAPVGGGTAIPGTGTGLVGLAERAGLAGGRLTHGPMSNGDFELRAWLPWPKT